MYYESHVTIEPVFGWELESIEEIAKKHKFKVAKLLMQKRDEDTPERSKYDTFMTGHSISQDDLENRMEALIDDVLELL